MFKKIKKNTQYICSITESALKVLRCSVQDSGKSEFSRAAVEAVLGEADEKQVSARLVEMVRRMGYAGEPLLICLPRHNATSRCLKVPANSPPEIEKIVSLQAPRLFPYPANELNSGFQIIQTDAQGYTDVNVVIAHRAVIERYLKVSQELKAMRLSVTLSSFGLCALHNWSALRSPDPVLVIDVDGPQVEAVIVANRKFLFSRAFRVPLPKDEWGRVCLEELRKTLDLYQREVKGAEVTRAVVVQCGPGGRELIPQLKEKLKLSAEELSFSDRLKLSAEVKQCLNNATVSFAALIGLGLERMSEYVNLLPTEVKAVSKSQERSSHWRQLGVVLSLALCLALAGLLRQVANKESHLKKLKAELAAISEQSKSLEEIARRLELLEKYADKGISALDVFAELHKAVPDSVMLSSFVFEENSGLIIRGHAPELDRVFDFVSRLQKSVLFRGFTVKVRYATKKKTRGLEFIDFEILCEKGGS